MKLASKSKVQSEALRQIQLSEEPTTDLDVAEALLLDSQHLVEEVKVVD